MCDRSFELAPASPPANLEAEVLFAQRVADIPLEIQETPLEKLVDTHQLPRVGMNTYAKILAVLAMDGETGLSGY